MDGFAEKYRQSALNVQARSLRHYTHCHLCEKAEAMGAQAGASADHVDIADDDGLIERDGIRIPVLKRSDSGAELGWPFDAEMVRRFVA